MNPRTWPEQYRVICALRKLIAAGQLSAVWVTDMRVEIEQRLGYGRIPIRWSQAVRLADGESVEGVLAQPVELKLIRQRKSELPEVRRAEYLAERAAA